MTVKRGRTGSSSTHLNEADSVNVGESPRSSIFTIGYPVKVGVFDRLKIGEFLEQCCYCRKRIDQNKDVFMYGNLRAFCTAECREIQMMIDRAARKRRSKSKKVVHSQSFSI